MQRPRPLRARPQRSFLSALLGACTLYPIMFSWVQLAGKYGGGTADPENAPTDSGSCPSCSLHPYHHDGTLVWHRPIPDRVIPAGWEDDWMLRWKAEQFDSNSTRVPRCVMDEGPGNPYDDGVLCEMPGYIPARIVDGKKHKIPRVIFLSWFTRKIGRAMFTSIMSLVTINPEYEVILFVDDDVDRFVCESVGEDFALPLFSRVRRAAGAMRIDIWRLLVMQKYGGVYLDSDLSALAKLPIEEGDTAVSGVCGFGYLPADDAGETKIGGALEHWSMCFSRGHPFINKAVEHLKRNLREPEYLMRNDTPEAKVEDSFTMRLTGPAMYQSALIEILNEAKCKEEVQEDGNEGGRNYADALKDPEKSCEDMATFREWFPEGLRLFDWLNLNQTVTHKVFYPGGSWLKETEDFHGYSRYDNDSPSDHVEAPDLSFCNADTMTKRRYERQEAWAEAVKHKANE